MTRLRFVPALLLLALVAFSATPAAAEIRLPGFFGDHMVLQQEMPLPVWGWADPGQQVTVTLGGNKATATADAKGNWKVELPAMKAGGGPQKLTATSGDQTVTLSDILLGEVWLCSGQSNMEWTVQSSTNAGAEIAAANYPEIRQIKFNHLTSAAPQNDVSGTWQICSPQTAGGFTACGYFMARTLYKELNVPVGLINSSWGGTRIEPWTPPVGFAGVDELKDLSSMVQRRTPGTPENTALTKGHMAAVEKWLADAKAKEAAGQPIPASPAAPDDLQPHVGAGDPTAIYNSMIHPLIGLPFRGAIWYQGESNHGEGMLYKHKMDALITGWRKIWNMGDFPFFYVQIAPYMYGDEKPEVLPIFWEAQAAALDIPNTGMVVINDVATLNDIHPPKKQEVGLRLANLALRDVYDKQDVVADGPTFKELKQEKGALRVVFDNVAGGLKSRDDQPLTDFEVIGVDSGWVKADARIDGDSVILTSKEIDQPVAMRFAWNKAAEPNLVNSAGLPTSAFRAGEVPKPDALPKVGAAKGFKLIYDLDLATLPQGIKYDVDNSKQPIQFDRIGYLLELQTSGGERKAAFVSMDAFTDDLTKIGVPTFASGASFQQPVKSLTIWVSGADLATGTDLDGGNIEFWPNNYATQNSAKVPGASDQLYDFGDAKFDPVDGYGSMQVHNGAGQQTVFAINHWRAGNGADIGIGNSTGETRDWTFNGNASQYTHKRLRVLVRPVN
ncbi:9-O-acetylesterase [Blastopirellula sp. JC732]|uniref:9-O-acetylesterase n=1 Tax=Blastopirellula sediminis TaxID=2894196 RepID=A0A9X1MR58_9BACT|nr:sialate O-acetylesterase [Blastopirellula sediminis]MCC9605815.1 9-O-acetylesterase [Blastopirellula sediminis]MCC9630885.1 9-O-acetylesterase [Blastopirellula sediminis]